MNKVFFEKSRIKNFNDAVFSIAMTLLILEITIPSGRAIGEYGTLRVLQTLIPSFIGFFVSFLVTALHWVSHLRVMQYATVITPRMVWMNIFLLLFIVLLPFSTAFYVSGIEYTGPFVFYCLNLTFIELFNYFLIKQVMKSAYSRNKISANTYKWQKARAINPLVIWILAAALAFVLPNFARFVFFLIFLIQPLIDRYYRKKLVSPEEEVVEEYIASQPDS